MQNVNTEACSCSDRHHQLTDDGDRMTPKRFDFFNKYINFNMSKLLCLHFILKLKTAFFQNRLWFSTPRQETDLWFQNMNILYSSLPFIKV